MKSKIRLKSFTVAFFATGLFADAGLSYAAGTVQNGINVGEVSNNVTAETESTKKQLIDIPSYAEIAKSGESILKVGKSQLGYLSPSAGAFNLAAKLPGVVMLGSNTNSGLGSNSININGFGVGTGPSVNSKFASVQINFDGIPMNDPLGSDGGFYSMEIPIAQLFKGTTLIYGPGNPASRWQNSIGGTVNFVPIQPSANPKGGVSLSYGSYGAKTAFAYADTGIFAGGWTIALAGGYTDGEAPGLEYDYPTKANMFYLKAKKLYHGGDHISFGVYGTTGSYYSVPGIPVTPVAGYTTNGYDVPGPLLSEATSGFYSTETIPQSYFRYSDSVWLFYSKQYFKISKNSSFKNKIWFRNSDRSHIGLGTYDGDTSPELDETYLPIFYGIGDRGTYNYHFSNNNVKVGAFLYYTDYTNPCWLFNQPVLHQTIADASYETNNSLSQIEEYGFMQDELSFFNNKLIVTPGIAYAAYQTNDNNLVPPNGSPLLSPIGYNGSYDYGSQTNFGGVEPSLAVNYEVAKHIYLYAYGAHTNVNPNNREYGNEVGFYVNPEALGLTTDTDFEFGIRYKSRKLFSSINYYHSDVHNIVKGIYANGSDLFPTGFKVGNALYQGVDLQVNYTPFYWLKAYASGNIQHPYYTKLLTSSGQSFAGNVPSGIPLHSFLIGFEVRKLIDGGVFSTNLDDHYIGPAAMANIITGDNTLKTEPYNLVNLSFGYKTPFLNQFIPGTKYITFKLGIYNLLNRKYNEGESIGTGIDVPGIPDNAVFGNQGAPRTIFGTLAIKF